MSNPSEHVSALQEDPRETHTVVVPTATIQHLESVNEVRSQVNAIQGLMKEVMQDGIHYGVIPGTQKPTLYKAGAEKIGLMLRLAPAFSREMMWDGVHLTVQAECTLTHTTTGTVIASAGGMCSTRETKYAFRQATRKCPACKAGAIKWSKFDGGGWYCHTKAGGCNAKFAADDDAITSQSEGREDNPNIADTYNTVLKMADKRAYVAAMLFGTAASDIYTQDLEDFPQGTAPQQPPQNAPQSSNAPQQAPAPPPPQQTQQGSNRPQKCKKCGVNAVWASKEEYGGGHYCSTKHGGCGAKYPPAQAAPTPPGPYRPSAVAQTLMNDLTEALKNSGSPSREVLEDFRGDNHAALAKFTSDDGLWFEDEAKLLCETRDIPF